MNNKCCRLQYLLPPDKIMKIFAIYGKDIEIFDNSTEGEPNHGWLMNKPEEGYPCDHLTPNGCQFVLDGGEKPFRCQRFPIDERELALIDTCGFYFVNGERKGYCHGCKQ